MGPNDTKHIPFIYCVQLETLYAQFLQLQREFQLDLAEPVTNLAWIATGDFTDTLDKRREKVITRMKKSNTQAASAINKIHPSSQHTVAMAWAAWNRQEVRGQQGQEPLSRGERPPGEERIRSPSKASKDNFCSTSSDQGQLRPKDKIIDIPSSERICCCEALQAHPRVGSGGKEHHPSAGQGQGDPVPAAAQDHFSLLYKVLFPDQFFAHPFDFVHLALLVTQTQILIKENKH